MKAYCSADVFRNHPVPLDVTRRTQAAAMVPHTHDYIEIVLVSQGHTIHTVHCENGSELSYSLIRGDLFSVIPGEIHRYSASKNLVLYNVAMLPELIAAESGELSGLNIWNALFGRAARGVRDKIHLTPCRRAAAEAALACIMRGAARSAADAPGLRAKTAFLDFLFAVGDAETMRWETGTAGQEGIYGSISRLEHEPAKAFDLNTEAHRSGMSVSAYTKKFRAVTGTSPLDYLIGLRLENVRRQLLETGLSISEIACANGFCDGTYLVKLFRQRCGITPTRYRRLESVSARSGSGD